MTKSQFSKEFLSKIIERIDYLKKEERYHEAQKLTDVYLINNEKES